MLKSQFRLTRVQRFLVNLESTGRVLLGFGLVIGFTVGGLFLGDTGHGLPFWMLFHDDATVGVSLMFAAAVLSIAAVVALASWLTQLRRR